MSALIDIVTAVWSPAALAISLIGGGVFGWSLVRVAAGRDKYPRPVPVPRGYASRGLALLMVYGGTIFYAGQVVEAIGSGDAGVDRITSRFTIWLVFCVGSGLGAYFALGRSRL